MSTKTKQNSTNRPANTIPELEHSKAAVLNTLASEHSRRSYPFGVNQGESWTVLLSVWATREASETVTLDRTASQLSLNVSVILPRQERACGMVSLLTARTPSLWFACWRN